MNIEMFFTPSMIMGPVRMILLFMFIVYLKDLVTSKKSIRRGLDFYIPGFVVFMSTTVLGCYILMQVSAFDEFVFLLLVFGFIIMVFLNLKRDSSLSDQLQRKKNSLVLFAVSNFEKHKTLRSFLTSFRKRKKTHSTKFLARRKGMKIQYGIFISLVVIAYCSRYYFFLFDSFMLSDLWYEDLKYIKDMNAHNWFIENGSMMGEFAIISMYSLISDTNDLIALQSFGLLESAIVAGMLFWSTSRLTNSRYIPGLVAALAFTFLLGFIPLDVSLMTKHKSTFLALTFVLPLFVFVLKPETLSDNPKSYFLKMLLIFSAVAFIDLFVMMIVLPSFLLVTSVFSRRDKIRNTMSVTLSYFLGLVLVLLFHFVAAVLLEYSFEDFILSNLYSVSSYTYTPQLVAPLDVLMQIYFWCAVGMSLITFPLWLSNKKRWNSSMVLVAFTATLLFMSTWNGIPVDQDLLYQMISVIVPVFFGISLYIMNGWIEKMIHINTSVLQEISISVLTIGLVVLLFQNNILSEIPRRNIVKEEIIEAYDALEEKNLPFSYSVVNSSVNEVIGENDHFFINYNYFNREYIVRDSVYAAHRKDLAFLKKNTDIVLPNSTFVFLYNEGAIADVKNKLNDLEQNETQLSLQKLRNVKRDVRLFLQKTSFSVYEIINEPNATKIEDIIFFNNHQARIKY